MEWDFIIYLTHIESVQLRNDLEKVDAMKLNRMVLTFIEHLS